MRWRDRSYDYRRVFALFPVSFGSQTIWLEWYWRRFAGDYWDCALENPNVPRAHSDGFDGDTAHLIRSIEALLALDAANALVPHGIGGHARALLTAASKRLKP